jgi:hypothetical protein
MNEQLIVKTLPGLLEWLAGGSRGSSSNTIVQHITELPANKGRVASPLDPDDMTRCIRLLEAVPALAGYFQRMQTASPEWAALVPRWQEIVSLMDEENPNWRTDRRWSAPRSYALMQEILKTARSQP